MTLKSGIAIPVEPGAGLPPDAYRATHKVDYEPPSRTGYLTIPCLEFLKGQPWDRVALDYVHALRPSTVRVTTGAVTCDSRLHRVTVTVDEAGVILDIRQESEVGLVGAEHGADLAAQLRDRARTSPTQ